MLSKRPLVIGVLVGVLGSLLIALFVIGPLVIAKHDDLPLERTYGDFAVSIASRIGGGNAVNPQAQSPRALVAGREAYTGSCGVCHGSTGDGRGVFGVASYPNATDLRSHDAVEKSDAQLFWIIKNGLAFTGMPGFAEQYDDQATWSMVSYIRALQDPSRVPQARGGRSGPGGRGGPFTLGPMEVPTPTTEQLDRADPHSADPVGRGAAIYFAQGCQTCHAADGNMPGDLALRSGGSPEDARAVRQGRTGMPASSETQITDAELGDLQAYLRTIGTTRRGGSDRSPNASQPESCADQAPQPEGDCRRGQPEADLAQPRAQHRLPGQQRAQDAADEQAPAHRRCRLRWRLVRPPTKKYGSNGTSAPAANSANEVPAATHAEPPRPSGSIPSSSRTSVSSAV